MHQYYVRETCEECPRMEGLDLVITYFASELLQIRWEVL